MGHDLVVRGYALLNCPAVVLVPNAHAAAPSGE